MAKRKASKPETKLSRATPSAFGILGLPEWAEWVRRAMRHCGARGINDFADEAFIAYAKSRGFTEPAPPRVRPRPGSVRD